MLSKSLGDDAELVALEPWQAPEFAKYVDDERAHLQPWLPWVDLVTDEESARDWLQSYADSRARDGGRVFGIRRNDELVGGTLFRVFSVRSGVCELGVWLSRKAAGQGLITRSCRYMIDWAIGVRGLSRVEYRVVPENTPSIAVAERLGMTYEGTLRQAFPHRGRRHDLQVWASLADDT